MRIDYSPYKAKTALYSGERIAFSPSRAKTFLFYAALCVGKLENLETVQVSNFGQPDTAIRAKGSLEQEADRVNNLMTLCARSDRVSPTFSDKSGAGGRNSSCHCGKKQI